MSPTPWPDPSGPVSRPQRPRRRGHAIAARQVAAIASLAAVWSLWPAAARAATALRVSPPMMQLRAPAGAVRTFSVRVANDGAAPLPVSVSSAGVDMDPDGVPAVAPPDSEWSCASWIELDKTAFELPAGGSERVNAELRIPRGVRGGRYAVVLFRTKVGGSSRGPLRLALATSTASVVMVTISRTGEREGRVSKLGIEPLDDGALQFTAMFENAGNVHVTVGGLVVVRGDAGRVVARLPLETGTGTVLPGGARRATARWDRWQRCPDGEYTAEVHASFHGLRPARRTVRFLLSRGGEGS